MTEIMAETYSQVWVTIHCNKNPQEYKDAINVAWREVLGKYEDQGVVNDTGSIVGVGNEDLNPQLDGNKIEFGLGSYARNGGPDYEEQYQAMGEMVWRVQEEMVDWNVEVDIQKTGASG